jgi:hypothetical protein
MSAVVLSCAIIGLHGAMRVPDDLFLDDTDVSAGQVDPFKCLVRGRFGSICWVEQSAENGGPISSQG